MPGPRALGRALAPSAKEKHRIMSNKPSGDWVSTSRDWKQLVLFNNDAANYQYTAAWKRLETLASEMNGEELTRAYTEMANFLFMPRFEIISNQ
jgi:hypothetical protein